jgi:hypothetical protein
LVVSDDVGDSKGHEAGDGDERDVGDDIDFVYGANVGDEDWLKITGNNVGDLVGAKKVGDLVDAK